MKYFDKIKTVEELKKEYCRLAKILHPDAGGDTADFQTMQNEFEKVFENVKNIHIKSDGTTYEKTTTEKASEYMQIINELLTLKKIIIDLLGNWIWVSGDTKSNKEKLKKMGFKYSGLKKCWYWHDGKYRRGTNKSDTLKELKEKYEHTVYYSKNEDLKKLA